MPLLLQWLQSHVPLPTSPLGNLTEKVTAWQWHEPRKVVGSAESDMRGGRAVRRDPSKESRHEGTQLIEQESSDQSLLKLFSAVHDS